MKHSPQRAGGIATAIKRRKEGLEKYNANPNYCLYCHKKIKLPIGSYKFSETRKKKFCNRKCSSAYNNTLSPKRKKITRYCKKCGNQFHGNNTKNCPDCWKAELRRISLGEKRNISRQTIATNARTVIQSSIQEKKCKICGYSLHVEVCHIKPVKDFADTAPIKEINNLKNLIYLCPNCHWEFDNNRLIL